MILDQLIETFNTFKIIATVVSVFFLFLIIRYLIKTDALGGFKKYKLQVYKYGGDEKKRIPARWKRVMALVQSKYPDDWKQAILYADGMFDDMLKLGGYTGATATERLAKIDSSQIESIDVLRAARNKVFSSILAEEELVQTEVKELLREYRDVFQGMGYL